MKYKINNKKRRRRTRKVRRSYRQGKLRRVGRSRKVKRLRRQNKGGVTDNNCLQRLQEARQEKEHNCLARIKGFKVREKQLIKSLNDDCMKDIEKQYNIGFKEGYKQHKLDSIYKN